MDSDNKNTLSGFVGHSISTFCLFSFNNSNYYNSDSSNYSLNNNLTEHINHESYDNNLNKLKLNGRNGVAYNRFVSNVHLDESRALLYGSWDPEDSEKMWNDINGSESDENLIFNNSQFVREEDLIKFGNKLDVTLYTNHLNDFVNYHVNENNNENEYKFDVNNKYVLLFGGVHLNEENFDENYNNLFTLLNGNNELEYSNELYYSEAQSFKSSWEQLDCLNQPEPRAFHSACVLYSNLETPVLAVCGGLGVNQKLLDSDLYLLNLSRPTLEWKVFKTTGPSVPKRYGHTMAQVGKYILLFGGTDGSRLYNEIWALNVNEGPYQVPGELSGNSWFKVEFDGSGPSPRAFHSCCKIGISSNTPMVVYGGLSNVETARNRLYALHFLNEEKMKWSLLPVYIKCPSEIRAFHSMTFVDNKFVITGGEDFKNDYNTNMRSLSYSLEDKSFQYIEDTVQLAGHKSWCAYGMIYHWGGLSKNNGKVTFDESISISNPLTYSDDSNIEEIYYKYIRFASMNNQYESSKQEGEMKTDEREYKNNEMELDNKEQKKEEKENENNNNNNKDEKNNMTLLEDQITTTSTNNNNENNVTQKENKEEKTNEMSTNTTENVEIKTTSAYGGRPRRSAALKCLTAIELDNKRHKELEKEL